MNLKMYLKIDSSTVVFFCEYCKIFKITFYIEHRRTASSVVNIDAKYSLPSQQISTSMNSAEKPGYQLQRWSVWVARDGQSDGISKLWRTIKSFLLIFMPGFYMIINQDEILHRNHHTKKLGVRKSTAPTGRH